MNNKPISEARDADLRNSQAALERAAKSARDIARKTGTPLVVKHNGKIAPDKHAQSVKPEVKKP